MTVIIQYSDHTDRWVDISKLVQTPGFINLYRDREMVKQVSVVIRLEIIP